MTAEEAINIMVNVGSSETEDAQKRKYDTNISTVQAADAVVTSNDYFLKGITTTMTVEKYVSGGRKMVYMTVYPRADMDVDYVAITGIKFYNFYPL